MPYRNLDARRRVQREAQRRRRGAARASAGHEGMTSPPVNPAVALATPPPVPPSRAELERAGAAIHCPRMAREDDAHYHERLRDRWRAIRAVLEVG